MISPKNLKQFCNLFVVVLCFAITTTSCTTNINEDLVEETQEVQEVETSQNNNFDFIEPLAIEVETLKLINDYRVSKNLQPLQTFNLIKVPSLDHTNYMIDKSSLSHDNFEARVTFLKENETAIQRVGENVAYGFTDAQNLVNAWIDSEGHRENIEGNFNYFDMIARQDSSGAWYYTNIFIRK